jgi:hypothetical protein
LAKSVHASQVIYLLTTLELLIEFVHALQKLICAWIWAGTDKFSGQFVTQLPLAG